MHHDYHSHFELIFGKHFKKYNLSEHKSSSIHIVKCPEPNPVPLPGAFPLFGTVLLGFVLFGKRFVKSAK